MQHKSFPKNHYLCSGFQIGKIKSDKEKEPKRNYKNRKLSTGIAGSLSAQPMVGRTKFLTYGLSVY